MYLTVEDEYVILMLTLPCSLFSAEEVHQANVALHQVLQVECTSYHRGYELNHGADDLEAMAMAANIGANLPHTHQVQWPPPPSGQALQGQQVRYLRTVFFFDFEHLTQTDFLV